MPRKTSTSDSVSRCTLSEEMSAARSATMDARRITACHRMLVCR